MMNICRVIANISCKHSSVCPPATVLFKAQTQLGTNDNQALQAASLHTSMQHLRSGDNFEEVSDFMKQNDIKYPPLKPGEKPRPRWVCNEMRNIKYSPKKMWYVATLVRGMAIDDAINQLKFVHKKGAVAVLDTILEAQRMAVEQHNIEFPSNLWISESYSDRDHIIYSIRRHGKMFMHRVKHRYTRYSVKLEEGSPPEHYYYHTRELQPQEHIQNWLTDLRDRQIHMNL